jgi:hypothetical protein
MTGTDLPEDWYREVTGPDGTPYYVVKAVRRGQRLTWDNDAWFANLMTVLVFVLTELFRGRALQAEAKQRANDGDYLVGVIHDGHWRVRIVRSEYVGSPAEVADKLDEFEAAVRGGRLR